MRRPRHRETFLLSSWCCSSPARGLAGAAGRPGEAARPGAPGRAARRHAERGARSEPPWEVARRLRL